MTLPPGRARLVTSPVASGSDSRSTATIGIVRVAFAAATTAAGEIAAMTSTGRRTSSAAMPRIASLGPGRMRYSIARFVPSA